MNRYKGNGKKRRSRRIALLTVTVILVPLFLGNGGAAVARPIDDREVKVRILEGRIDKEVVFRFEGLFTAAFGERKIEVVDESLSISISGTGGLTLHVGGKRYETGLDIVIVAAGDDSISAGPDTTRMKRYRGKFNIHRDGDTIAVINIVPLRQYLYSVTASEMTTRELEAMKAQAILARTFAVGNLKRHGTYDFCDKTHCQHYGGANAETPTSVRAVDETAGLFLLFEGRPARVFYHACCGGVTTTPVRVWGGSDLPYQRRVECKLPGSGPLCSTSDHFRWEARVEKERMKSILSDAFGLRVENITVLSRDPSGRVSRIKLAGPATEVIIGEEFRIAVGRALGWSTIKSTLFEMETEGGYYIFRGRGLGHGVGMCQEGAMALSRLGWSCEEILQFYFPGTEVGEIEE